MATLQEHMVNDFTYSLAEVGEEITVDTETAQAFVTTLDNMPGEFARTFVTSKRILHLPGAIAEKVPGQIVSLGDERWLVVDHRVSGPSGCLIVERSES